MPLSAQELVLLNLSSDDRDLRFFSAYSYVKARSFDSYRVQLDIQPENIGKITPSPVLQSNTV